MKQLKFATFVIGMFLSTGFGIAQDITGIVKSKSSTINFEDFGYDQHRFSGEIKSNLSGSKYSIMLKSEAEILEGNMMDKLSNFELDLNYKDDKIEGLIKRSLSGVKDEWDINFLNKKLSGLVNHNAAYTVDTYDLTYGTVEIRGTIKRKVNTLVYDLLFDNKKVTGTMALNVTSVKHTYKLQADTLTEDEFAVLLLIESINLIKERIEDIDDFQNSN